MIEGLRLLPWVLEHRRKRKQKAYCDCSHCLDKVPEETRALLGCGFLPASKRGRFIAPSEWADISSGVCAGWFISLPQVIETARLHTWWDKGQLRDRLEGQPSSLLCDCLDVLEASRCAVEAHVLEELGEHHAQ